MKGSRTCSGDALKKAEDKRPNKISLIIRYQPNRLKPKRSVSNSDR